MPSTFPSDFRWCIENDWQVYVVPYGNQAKIGIRKGGISSHGKNYHTEKGIVYRSTEQLGEKIYDTQQEAGVEACYVMKKLKQKYG